MLHSIIYISETAEKICAEDLALLLEHSQTSNKLIGVTGMLLYIERPQQRPGGRFMQVLEGEKEEVQKLFAKIKTDKRHYNVLSVSEDDISSRNFKNWSMGFKKLQNEEFQLVSGYLDLSNEVLLDRKLAGLSKPINYLKSFYQIHMSTAQ